MHYDEDLSHEPRNIKRSKCFNTAFPLPDRLRSFRKTLLVSFIYWRSCCRLWNRCTPLPFPPLRAQSIRSMILTYKPRTAYCFLCYFSPLVTWNSIGVFIVLYLLALRACPRQRLNPYSATEGMPSTNIILRTKPQLEFLGKSFLVFIPSLGRFFISSFPAIESL